MFTDIKDVFRILNDILNTYNNLYAMVETIKQKCNKTVKSFNKSASSCGLYYPDKEFYKYFEYRGKITKSETKYTFKYYYEDERVLLTEKYGEEYGTGDSYTGKYILNAYIFYFYYDNYTDVIFYNPKDKKIIYAGRVIYVNNKIHSYVKTEMIDKSGISGYDEFIFIENSDYLYQKHYYRGFGEHSSIRKVRKYYN